MKRVIIESPFAGDVTRNLRYARAAMADSLRRDEAPIASHLLYTQPGILDDARPEERMLGIEAGLRWGALAELTAVYGDLCISSGMALGVERARAEGRPVEYRSIEGQVDLAATEEATILVRGGTRFNLTTPELSEYTIDDIAHGLSMVCRFSGQTRDFYSVAQHSVLVAEHLPPDLAYAGLMHDAAEAFIGDMATPMKRGDDFYRATEKRIEAVIFPRFGLSARLPAAVKTVDRLMLAAEQRQLMCNLEGWPESSWLDVQVEPVGPREAKALFLDAFERLRPAGVGR